MPFPLDPLSWCFVNTIKSSRDGYLLLGKGPFLDANGYKSFSGLSALIPTLNGDLVRPRLSSRFTSKRAVWVLCPSVEKGISRLGKALSPSSPLPRDNDLDDSSLKDLLRLE